VRPIYKILSRSEWAVAEAEGLFKGSAVDLADGYIHFSEPSRGGALFPHLYGPLPVAAAVEVRPLVVDAEAGALADFG
jgi:uncharacterized protein (DUF952 family)